MQHTGLGADRSGVRVDHESRYRGTFGRLLDCCPGAPPSGRRGAGILAALRHRLRFDGNCRRGHRAHRLSSRHDDEPGLRQPQFSRHRRHWRDRGRDLRDEGIRNLRCSRHAVADRQQHCCQQSTALVRQVAAAKHRFFRRSAFFGIHCPPHHRGRRRRSGDQSPHNCHRSRSDVADWTDDRHGHPGSGHGADRSHHGAAGFLFPAQADPARAQYRANSVHRRHPDHRESAGGPSGLAHGQGFRSGRRDAGSGSREGSPTCSTNPTRWRGSRTAPAH